ncbi:hypothetical protein JX265_002147 [Neoarthrinium moseri]|uniref:Uncharacterized protein n=1 Tax=Neoarthrinium moseri TaxID=1658444 RepID=A0A9Q0AU07_9PEZI|nr:hypothetical protein JX266_004109 [Neoarthrinium moseri]KAI1879193.1 hypothetical protein JX265_002147 [Neoarthrinium moseri]
MEPTGPAQPSKATAYTTEGNVVTSNPAEQRSAQNHTHGGRVEQRLPTSQASGVQEATPTSLARGIRGAPPGEEQFGRTAEQVGRNQELEGEQMRAPGEGDVADTVDRKPGASGSQPDLASDLDRKKAEQASKREAIKDARAHGTFSEGVDPRAGVET